MASSLCQAVNIQEVFHDHASVSVQLNIEILRPSIHTWPRPSEVPWPQVKLDEWHQHCETIELPTPDDSTDMMKELGKSFERSLAGFVTEF